MFQKLMLLLFGITSLVSGQRIQIDSNLTVDYILTYTGNNYDGKENNFHFDGVYENSSSFITHRHHMEECYYECSLSTSCVGIYQEFNGTLLYSKANEVDDIALNMSEHNVSITEIYDNEDNEDNNYICYLLSDLGLGFSLTNVSSNSYTKIQHHNYTKHLGNNSLIVYLWESSPANVHGNTTVYIDLNHNAQLDLGEPNISAMANTEVFFNNLNSGIYLVRTISPDFCYQLYPGLRGIDPGFGLYGDGYIDTVNTYYYHGHSKYVGPHGGIIGNNENYLNNNFSFILGNDDTTYLSFYPDNNITLGFVDETVLNDLYIDTYGESETWAHVSVSHDNIHFYHVGNLTVNSEAEEYSEDINSYYFNLTESELDFPVAFVRLHFMGENSKEALNIVSIYSNQESLQGPEFGYLVGVPQEQQYYYYYLFFYNECYNSEYCEEYCYFMSNNFNREESCLTGCNIFYETGNCRCSKYQEIDNVDFYGNEFDMEWCHRGCHYELGYTVAPEFVTISNKTGLQEDVIGSSDICDYNCIYNFYDNCVDNEECSSFSLHKDFKGELYNGFTYQDSFEDIMILRKSLYYNFSQLTTTITTTSKTVTETATTNTDTTTTETPTTTNTETSTSNTETSTSNTETSTSNTETSTSNTETRTSNTETSTSNTETSTSNTETSTSNTETITDTADTSDTSNSSRNINIPESSGESKDNTVLIVLVSLFTVIILGFMALAIVIYKRNKIVVNRPDNNRGPIGFDNPVYNMEPEMEHNMEEPAYQDTEPANNISDDNYLNIGE